MRSTGKEMKGRAGEEKGPVVKAMPLGCLIPSTAERSNATV